MRSPFGKPRKLARSKSDGEFGLGDLFGCGSIINKHSHEKRHIVDGFVHVVRKTDCLFKNSMSSVSL